MSKTPKTDKTPEIPEDSIYNPFFACEKKWEYFFTKSDDKDIIYPHRLILEDFLQHNKVFVNGISGRPCHSDSYMTCVDFNALDQAVKLLNETVNAVPSDWLPFAKTWAFGINMQPPFRLVGRILIRAAGLVPDEVEATMKIAEE